MPLMRRTLFLLIGLLCTAVSSLGQAGTVSPYNPYLVTVGIIDNNEPGYRAETITPTLQRLRSQLPEYQFRTVEIAAYQAVEDIGQSSPDFIVAPSDVFLTLINGYGAQAIAMRKTNFASDPARSAGSTVIVLDSRKDLQTLADLQGKNVAASLPDSLSGWLALQGEIQTSGFDHQHFFNRVDFMTFQIPDVINNVFAGYSDAGILSACQLETAEATGLVEKKRFRVINAKNYDGLECRHSTQLYPDQVFGVLNFSRPELVKRINLALLSMPDAPSFSWQVPGKFDSIASLYRTLQLGQWAPVQRTWTDYLRLFWKELAAVLGLILFLIANEIRLRRLVTLRTADLNDALDAQQALIAQDRNMRNRIAIMERNSLVAQMSSLIAHELKQPLAAILNYVRVIQMRLDRIETSDPTLEKSSSSIEREAHRLVKIVDRVRSYIKATPTRHARCSLSDIAKKALLSFQHYADYTPNVEVAITPNLFVNGDELEIEILILNLLKNAAQAISSSDNGHILLSVFGDGEHYTLSVSDNGPRLTSVGFQRLTHCSESTSPGGLGLGLGIVRSIADAHSATINITQLDPRGIRVCVTFDRATEDIKK